MAKDTLILKVSKGIKHTEKTEDAALAWLDIAARALGRELNISRREAAALLGSAVAFMK